MRRLCSLAALVLGLAATAATAEQLQRLTLRQELLGWEAVGRLDLGQTGYCTGVLIETDLVLTAAHCLFADDGTRFDPRQTMFRAGYRDGHAVAERQGARAVIHPGYRPNDPDRLRQMRHDVALVELAQSIPAATAPPFTVATLARGARDVSAVTYARGRSEALSAERHCALVKRAEGLMGFNCDVDFGSSGAPVFAMGHRRHKIVSLFSAKTDGRNGMTAIGMELAPRLAELKHALRTGEGVYPVPEIRALRLRAGERSTAGGAKFIRP